MEDDRLLSNRGTASAHIRPDRFDDLARRTVATLWFVLTLFGHAFVAAAQSQVSPDGSTPTRTPTFTWTASTTAQSYSLWVDDSQEEGKIYLKTISLDAAGCANGTGTCAVSPGVLLAPGKAYWQLGVQLSNRHSWIGEKSFTVPTTTSSADATAPIVTITQPTSDATYSSSTATLAIAGTASDQVGVSEVRWTSDRGASGVASGTTTWSANLPLVSGTNVLTVVARDGSNNVATDTLTVTYTPPSSGPVYPRGAIDTVNPVYRWNAISNAQSYSLWVDDSHEEGIIDLKTISPAAAGCPNGTGSCSVSPGVALAPGRAYWTLGVKTSSAHSWGAWVEFTVPDPNAPCLTLYPESQWHPADEQTGFIAVATNGCAWTATTSASWITITPGWTGGIGNGRVRYELSANTTGASRESDIVIGTRTYHVTQRAGTMCGAALSGYSDLYDANAHVESVQLSIGTSCAWTAVSSASWVALRADSRNGTGPATIRWDVAANTSGGSRSGTLTVAGRTYTVDQHGVPTGDSGCSYSISPLSLNAASGSASGQIVVSTSAGCAWSATSLSPFVDITGGFNGSGSGTVSYFVHDNTSTEARTGVLEVASRNVQLTQAGVGTGGCSYAISGNDPLPSGTATSSLTVSAPVGCPWTATAASEFLTITDRGSGNGTGSVHFAAANNGVHESRLGALTIAGQTVGIMQLGAGGEPTCVTAVTPNVVSPPAIGTAGTIVVSAQPNCVWSAVSGVPWVTLSGGSTTRVGSGSFSYDAGVNTGSARAVSIHIGAQEIAINQDGVTPTGNETSEIVWPAPQPKKANNCFGNCGGGCGTFLGVCGTNGGNWTSEVTGELRHVDDALLEVCSGGTLQLGVFPRYASTVRWTYHGVESPSCMAHDSLCRSWAGRLPFLIGKIFCGAAALGPYSYTICESARPWTWSYEESVVGRTMFPTAIVDNPDAPACGQQ